MSGAGAEQVRLHGFLRPDSSPKLGLPRSPAAVACHMSSQRHARSFGAGASERLGEGSARHFVPHFALAASASNANHAASAAAAAAASARAIASTTEPAGRPASLHAPSPRRHLSFYTATGCH